MNLPQAFCERMTRLLGEDAAAFFEGYSAPLRRGLRVNTAYIGTDAFSAAFAHALTPSPFAADTFYLDAPHKAGADPLHHAGAYYMQEPSASSAVTVLQPQKGEYILDLCAAPGGKSTQIAAALGGKGLLWCNEYVRQRAQVLCQNIERMGIRNAVVSNSDTTPLCEQLSDTFDAVLADVPCSGEGMFRKEPVALEQWSEALVAECAARGEMILNNAARAVREGGRLVYSTCTFAPEENEIQIAKFLQTHPDFELLPIEVDFGRPALSMAAVRRFDPTVEGNAPTELARRIFPADGGEGHFIALMRRKGDAPRRSTTHKPKKGGKPDPLIHAAEALLNECFTVRPHGTVARFGDTLRLIPDELPATDGIPLLCIGTAIGTAAKNRIEPHHALFASVDPATCRRAVKLDADDPRAAAFVHGESITVDCDDGYAAVCIEEVPCGFGKVTRGTLKNKYPKGLRPL